MKWVHLRYCQNKDLSYEHFKCLWLLYQTLILCPKSLISIVVVFAPLSPDYNVEFFRNFQLVMNALDNRGMIYSANLKEHYHNSILNVSFLSSLQRPGITSTECVWLLTFPSSRAARLAIWDKSQLSRRQGSSIKSTFLYIHFNVMLLAFMFCKFPNCRVRRNATSASLNLHRKPSQVAPFATRPLNPFTALCGPNISSSKFSMITSVPSHLSD